MNIMNSDTKLFVATKKLVTAEVDSDDDEFPEEQELEEEVIDIKT